MLAPNVVRSKQMLARRYHKNAIPKILKRKGLVFAKVSSLDDIPSMDLQEIRRYATGSYAIWLSLRYLVYARTLKRDVVIRKANIRRGLLLKISGLKSRFRSGKQRTVFLHYTKKGVNGSLRLTDTLCNCDGGRRVIGGCAHSVAILRYLFEQKTDTLESVTTKSEEELLQHFRIALEREVDDADD